MSIKWLWFLMVFSTAGLSFAAEITALPPSPAVPVVEVPNPAELDQALQSLQFNGDTARITAAESQARQALAAELAKLHPFLNRLAQ